MFAPFYPLSTSSFFMKKLLLPLAAAGGILLSGCGGGDGSSSTAVQDITSPETNVTRNLKPDYTSSEVATLAANNNKFAFEMFKELRATEGDTNIFYSPYSITQALAMTYVGAKGETKTQMAAALHFEQDDETLHNNFNWLDLHLNYTDDNYTFSNANSIWPQIGYEFEQSYIDAIMLNYGAKLLLLDFAADPDGAADTINQWVEEKTHERIKGLIPKGQLSTGTKLVLVNAVYFKAKWENEFIEWETYDESFTLPDGSSVQTAMMHQQNYFYYSEGENCQAIELPYKGGRTSMVVILPKEGYFSEVAENMPSVYSQSMAAFASTEVKLKMPKFEITTDLYPLKEPFENLGMTDPFDPDKADFTGMSKNPLAIGSILHKAYIKVGEEGTEAAAATAVEMVTTGIAVEPQEPAHMYIVRPFFYFIKDRSSGQILFMGLTTDPRAAN